MADTPNRTLSLDDLIAFNDEIASLVRAGIPLESGLASLAKDRSGTLGRISAAIAVRMNRGESLADAIAGEGNAFPKIYRVVLTAGLRAGRLPAALESLSGFAATLVEMRREIGQALIYPLLVLTLAYGLFVVFVLNLAVRFRDAYVMFHIEPHGALRLLLQLRSSLVYWIWILPAVLVVATAWWLASGGARLLQFEGASRPLGWVPGIGGISRNYHRARFSGLLALMIEHDVPLEEGIVLAAEATGGRALISAACQTAEAIRSTGQATAGRGRRRDPIPPFLQWLLLHADKQPRPAESLRQTAEMYRLRAANGAAWLRVTFPVLVAAVIGGGATALYALSLFLPLIGLWKDLAH